MNQTGKLGIALSGGGLRAAFFHIGVLARMAERRLLSQVEVISAVSGGSIIAALYYIHLKKLLESKADRAITDQDYVDLVQRMIRQFWQATRRNIRLKAFEDPRANLRLYRRDYSRSDRIAEVYDELLYRPAMGKSEPVEMRELRIFPPGQPDFHPRRDNPSRRHKIPILIINATTLNTGRNWHFTARTMGEPVRYRVGRPQFDEADSIPIRLRRPFDYFQIHPCPGHYLHHDPRRCLPSFTVAKAVAASAAVPGLFPPITLESLYRDGDDPVCVQLVDGGVHDNQGIDALLFENCERFVISDASGQLDFEHCPDAGALKVLSRAGAVLQDQVRFESLRRLFETRGREQVAFVHLRKGMEKRELGWIGWNGAPYPERRQPATTLAYGVDPRVQNCLAEIRTDLDAFHEAEACALMYDGYQIAATELPTGTPLAGIGWPFSVVAERMRDPDKDRRFLRQLEISRHNVGKILLLDLRLLFWSIGAALLALAWSWPYLTRWLQGSVPVRTLVVLLLIVALDWAGRHLARVKLRELEGPTRLLKPLLQVPLGGYQTIRRFLLRALLPVLGAVLIKVYLRTFNRLYLCLGRLSRS